MAKRNFRKRHKHGGEIIAGEDSGAEDDASVKKGIPSQIMANREEAGEADALSSQSADSHNQMVSETDMQKGLVRNSMRSFEESKGNKGVARKPGDKIDTERKQRWASLLAKRPSTKDGESMSNWLMEVLAVSDLDTPLKTDATESSPAPAPAAPPKEVTAPAPAPAAAAASSQSGQSDGNSSNDESEDLQKHNSGVVKKKRPAEFLSRKREPEAEKPPGAFAGGSFAEWKERKKQRKQSKNTKDTAEQE